MQSCRPSQTDDLRLALASLSERRALDPQRDRRYAERFHRCRSGCRMAGAVCSSACIESLAFALRCWLSPARVINRHVLRQMQLQETLAKYASTPGCMQEPPASHKSAIRRLQCGEQRSPAIFSYTGFTTRPSPAHCAACYSASSRGIRRLPARQGMVPAIVFIGGVSHLALFDDVCR